MSPPGIGIAIGEYYQIKVSRDGGLSGVGDKSVCCDGITQR